MTKQVHPVILDPKTQQFVDMLAAQGVKPIYQLSVEEARNVLDSLQSLPVAKMPAHIEERTLSGGPTGKVDLRIVRPQNAPGRLPAIMYFHGGGWILGNTNTHDRLVRELANATGAAIIFVNYTPSPEATYPTPVEQAYFATKYVAERGEEFSVDGSRLAVAGDSVGGNMATVVALLAAQRGGPHLIHQLLFYPVTDASLSTPSYEQFADGPWLTRPAMEWFWNAYAPDKSARSQPTVSPLNASLEQLRQLPPSTVITDENDVLRDEGEMYAHKLMRAGLDVTAVRYGGTIHDFAMLNPLASTPATCSAVGLAGGALRTALAAAQEASQRKAA